MRITVVGNSAANVGVVLAADLSLGGHEVTLARWNSSEIDFGEIERRGGILVQGDPNELLFRKLGTARLRLADSIPVAVSDAEIVLLDCAASEIEQRVAEIAPHLRNGQLVHFCTYSYWTAFRAWPILRQFQLDIVLSEAIAPPASAQYSGSIVNTGRLRRKIDAASFPATGSFRLDALRGCLPNLHPVKNVLQTGVSNLNLLVHPALALLNISFFEREGHRGEKVRFYQDGSTESATKLLMAQDAERAKLCAAMGVDWKSVGDHLKQAYEGGGESLLEIVRECPAYQNSVARESDIWSKWLSVDVPLALTPLTQIGGVFGVDTPMHDGFLAMYNVLLPEGGPDKITLHSMGLEGISPSALLRYAETGQLDGG
jgi:opine dehydrogenase